MRNFENKLYKNSISKDILNKLTMQKDIDTSYIYIEEKPKRIILLKGRVGTFGEKNIIENFILNMKYAKTVINFLKVEE